MVQGSSTSRRERFGALTRNLLLSAMLLGCGRSSTSVSPDDRPLLPPGWEDISLDTLNDRRDWKCEAVSDADWEGVDGCQLCRNDKWLSAQKARTNKDDKEVLLFPFSCANLLVQGTQIKAAVFLPYGPDVPAVLRTLVQQWGEPTAVSTDGDDARCWRRASSVAAFITQSSGAVLKVEQVRADTTSDACGKVNPPTKAATAASNRYGGPADNRTPEGAVRGMVGALYRSDAVAVRTAMLAPGRLSQALSCRTDGVITTLEAALNAMEQTIRDGFFDGVTIEIKSLTETGRRSVASGDLYRGCTATEPFELRTIEMRKHAVKGDIVNDAQETIDVIRLGDAWYVMLNHGG